MLVKLEQATYLTSYDTHSSAIRKTPGHRKLLGYSGFKDVILVETSFSGFIAVMYDRQMRAAPPNFNPI
jgi:hypothetical protein